MTSTVIGATPTAGVEAPIITPRQFASDCAVSQSIWDVTTVCTTTWNATVFDSGAVSSAEWPCSWLNYGPPELPQSCNPPQAEVTACPSGYTIAGNAPGPVSSTYGAVEYRYAFCCPTQYDFRSSLMHVNPTEGVRLYTDQWCNIYDHPGDLYYKVTDVNHVAGGTTTVKTGATLTGGPVTGTEGINHLRAVPVPFLFGYYRSGAEGVTCVPADCPNTPPVVDKPQLTIQTATTTFAPEPSCLDPINVYEIYETVSVYYYDDMAGSLPSSLPITWTQLGPRSPDPACYPHSTKSNEGVCPSGYTLAGSQGVERAFPSETTWLGTVFPTLGYEFVYDELCCPTAHNFSIWGYPYPTDFGTFFNNEVALTAHLPNCVTAFEDGAAAILPTFLDRGGGSATETITDAVAKERPSLFAAPVTFRHWTQDPEGWSIWIADDAPSGEATPPAPTTSDVYDSSSSSPLSASNSEGMHTGPSDIETLGASAAESARPPEPTSSGTGLAAMIVHMTFAGLLACVVIWVSI